MMLSTCTVEDFFQRANWQGLKPVETIEEETPSQVVPRQGILKPELNFTVERFFALNNWTGKKIQAFSESITEETPLEQLETRVYKPVYSLKMTVAEFFLRMVWRGQGKSRHLNIASIPVINQSPLPEPEKREINVKDLSDLL